MKRDDKRWRSRNKNRRKRFAGVEKRRKEGGRSKRVESQEEEPKEPMPDRLYEVQHQIWNAMGVASWIEYALESKTEPANGKPDAQSAAAALFKILADLATPLEEIIEELGGVTLQSEKEVAA